MLMIDKYYLSIPQFLPGSNLARLPFFLKELSQPRSRSKEIVHQQSQILNRNQVGKQLGKFAFDQLFLKRLGHQSASDKRQGCVQHLNMQQQASVQSQRMRLSKHLPVNRSTKKAVRAYHLTKHEHDHQAGHWLQLTCSLGDGYQQGKEHRLNARCKTFDGPLKNHGRCKLRQRDKSPHSSWLAPKLEQKSRHWIGHRSLDSRKHD